MRRLILGASILLLAAPAATASAPQVRLADDSPVRVIGWGFAHGARVDVKVAESNGAAYGRIVRATTTGRIDVRFSTQSIDSCDGYTITATSRSVQARKHIEIPPACGIVVTP